MDVVIVLLVDDLISVVCGDVVLVEDWLVYVQGFFEILFEFLNDLFVVEFDGMVVGMLQFIFIFGMVCCGVWWLLVEVVCVQSSLCFLGIGFVVMCWVGDVVVFVVGVLMVQFIFDVVCIDVYCFYECLGYVGLYCGFKYIVLQD